VYVIIKIYKCIVISWSKYYCQSPVESRDSLSRLTRVYNRVERNSTASTCSYKRREESNRYRFVIELVQDRHFIPTATSAIEQDEVGETKVLDVWKVFGPLAGEVKAEGLVRLRRHATILVPVVDVEVANG